jgi:hypothetical protein
MEHINGWLAVFAAAFIKVKSKKSNFIDIGELGDNVPHVFLKLPYEGK